MNIDKFKQAQELDKQRRHIGLLIKALEGEEFNVHALFDAYDALNDVQSLQNFKEATLQRLKEKDDDLVTQFYNL